ncbi:hypothetical protein FOL47_005960 [Perkinsus chesapeaki]|uniref:F-box/LRR-repeat protein 15/At3g58940/PEG3-like LRR domain-containing protein n=1 Tax=Perkinsus chesapeaki TaxID=330153 RepID=A0A7J6MYN8_PERCH|nr:hypothetical protein FOL47_005960 [Perkinsus chesapeaki]
MPPARVHLLNINPWMFEPSNRCIRDVFGVIRDIEENNKNCRALGHHQQQPSATTTIELDTTFRRRIEVVRMTLSGFMVHQQELPPLKVTLSNIRLLSLTYCTFPFTSNALPDGIRQVPWMPSMPVLDRLELRHMMAMNTTLTTVSGVVTSYRHHHLASHIDWDINIIVDALLEGILHRIPSLTTLLIDSSSSITNPDIPTNAPNLKYLTLSHCPRIMAICVEKVLRDCKGLIMLDTRTLTQLANEIHTDCMGNIQTLWLPPGVKEEYLAGILSHGHTKCLKYLGISEIEDINLSGASPTLETLSINRSERMPLPNISSFTITPQQHLERLSITFCRFDTARFRINGTFTKLKILSLQNVVYSHAQLSLLLSSTPFLTALDIALCDQTTVLPNNQQQQQRQRDPNSAARDDLEPLRVPGTSNPAIPVKFPRLKYLCLTGSKKVHYSAIVPSIISNANVLEHLKLLKIRPVYSIRSPSSDLHTVMISLLPPLPSTRVRLVRDILSEPTAAGERLLLEYSKRSEVDIFVAALTNQCWSMKSLVLSGSGSSYYDTSISNGVGNTTRLLQEYELFNGTNGSSSDISYLPSAAVAGGGDMRMRSVRDSVNNHYNALAAYNKHHYRSQISKVDGAWSATDGRHHTSQQQSVDDIHETYDTAMDGDGSSRSDGDDGIGEDEISAEDSIMLDVMIELTIAIALGLIARIVAVNEIIHSSYNNNTTTTKQQQEEEGDLRRRVRISRRRGPPGVPDATLDGHPLEDDDDEGGAAAAISDDDDDDTPMLVLPSPTAVTPPSPVGDIMDDDDIIAAPPPPSISVAPHPPPLRSIQQLIIMHRMPMSGLELDAPPGSIEWDAYYRETMAILMSAPVRSTFNILTSTSTSNVNQDNRVSSGSLEAKHKAVYEYGKAYESMLGRYNAMKTAQATVMTQLPDRQQEQMLWKGLLIQATGVYPTEGAYSSKIISHRKALLRYKDSPRDLREYLSSRRAVNIELTGLLYRRLAQIPNTDRWGARCRPTEDRENDIITGCLRNALTPAGVIGGGIAILPLREGSSYLPKLFDNIPVHLMAPLLVDRLTSSSSSSLPSSSMATTTIDDVGLIAQYSEVMEMCISMHIQFDTIELKQPGYHIVQTAIAEANAKDRSTRGPLPALPVEIQDNLSLIRVAVAMVTTGRAELEARSRPIEEATAQRRKTAIHRLLMSLVYGRLINPVVLPVDRLETLSLDTLVELLRVSVNAMAVSLYKLRSGKVYGNIIERVSHTSITNPPWCSRSLEAMKLKYPALTNLSRGDDDDSDNEDNGYEPWVKLEAFKHIRSKFPNLVVLQVELPEPTLSQLHHIIEGGMNPPVRSSGSLKRINVPPRFSLCHTTLLPRVHTLPYRCNDDAGEDDPPAAKRSRLTYVNSSSDGTTVNPGLRRVASNTSVATTTRLSQTGDGGDTIDNPILHFNSVDTEWYRTTQCTSVKEDMMKLEWRQCSDRDLAIN